MTDFEVKAIEQLTRIADNLGAIFTVLDAFMPEQSAREPVCEHPVEAREDFGVTGGTPDWLCNPKKGGCGYRSVTEAVHA